MKVSQKSRSKEHVLYYVVEHGIESALRVEKRQTNLNSGRKRTHMLIFTSRCLSNRVANPTFSFTTLRHSRDLLCKFSLRLSIDAETASDLCSSSLSSAMAQPNFVQLRDGLATTIREIMRFQNMPAVNNAAATGEVLAANQQIGVQLNQMKETLNQHTLTLNQINETLNQHTEILNQHTEILNQHTKQIAAISEQTQELQAQLSRFLFLWLQAKHAHIVSAKKSSERVAGYESSGVAFSELFATSLFIFLSTCMYKKTDEVPLCLFTLCITSSCFFVSSNTTFIQRHSR
ncbi:hypothetical protein DFH11DRAFT_1609984 [Phellopilus nigrolimitatus]|nr:hypothetical protein DFH11DRAFT_1609984 [Phellopilus nigrolimitatus]